MQLSKQDEGEEAEVRKEDQERINRFSTLHRKVATLEDELKTKNVSGFARQTDLDRANSRQEGEGGPRGDFNGARAS